MVEYHGNQGNTLEDLYFRLYDHGDDNRKRVIKDVVWHAYLWFIWKGRNEVVFAKSVFIPRMVVDGIHRLAFRWVQNRSSFGRSLKWDDWSCNMNLM
ncbi:hypothetical protein OSB04_020490 [Centaurea solstitialis]|uniref:Uncharacterized protein n=1 Tax=Centaurea solstitialis TaxID=347529 RepID=A0AA38TAR7_9ASTR|nr:hypothetical protein OSB04_020490 [Centaurea solstitialis]